METIIQWVYIVFTIIFIALSILYVAIATIATKMAKYYKAKNIYAAYEDILSSELAPSISIIAPAYNEGLTIVENVRSLLSLHYLKYEIIIINDGSKDDSLEKLIKAYELERIPYTPLLGKFQTQPIKNVYQSKSKIFSKLTVIDKENGGKSDALNAGINLAQYEIVCCIDVDCILEQDSLLKMSKLFMEETDRKVIAAGGVIRVANSCKFQFGKITEVNLPKGLLAKMQVLEYSRSFLLGRLAWSKLNGLLIISGAFGLFDKEILIKAGGYSTNTIGEDMELVIRMRRYMEETGSLYTVVYSPDLLCWTETPESIQLLGKQRKRWTRGMIQSLKAHKIMFLNPEYSFIGTISFTFWVIFEWAASIIEFFGILLFPFLLLFGVINWMYFLSLLACVCVYSWMFSLWALYIEEQIFHQYQLKDLVKLIGCALIEPFVYHPLITWFSIEGNYAQLMSQKNTWGDMQRKGFENKK
ncbi:glycosyl transferase family 2 (plasmid) [Emticicia oligotrophica DSM 17448]|uniref:Glycosyl transferase family 2 n=1 Tax=Emticicia oligotrophica (strain DSM 17448 / CIP 109782 / MTCC 6937 / GPTSA100-15) TaxID=929562 RepID=A0ABM5N8B7_EMTOG|nr:glycosyltransferase family 2 protein [Emticicia oligotrophica]AFK05752.1 glycosyl transferase family 2 [Emticicia oligotrophica DSM 17448]